MKRLIFVLAAVAMMFVTPALAQKSAPKPQTIITNVKLFNSKR